MEKETINVNNPWVPARRDSLPEEGVTVLISSGDGVQTARRIKGCMGGVVWESTVNAHRCWGKSEVTHWMPLPKAPDGMSDL